MKILPSRKKTEPTPIRSQSIPRHTAVDGMGLYCEDYFREMLQLERKKSERNKRPFLLMLVELDGLSGEPSRKDIIRRLSFALMSSTRETDLKGWHVAECVMGAILLLNGPADERMVREKMLTALRDPAMMLESFSSKLRITFHLYPEPPEDNGKRESFDSELYPDLRRKSSSNRWSLFAKRVIDVAGGLLGLALFLPLFIAIPILIKLTSKGPVFFRQKRIGHFGRPFVFLKFRSMYINNDERIHSDYIKRLINEEAAHSTSGKDGSRGAVYKIKNDPRITPLGAILRKTSFDELPQFFNVLKGEMSLVGPRPPIPYELDNYDLWHLRRLQELKPGITGLWQVKGRSKTTFNEMVRMDIRYINEWSIWLDLKILLMTPWAVLTARGAY